VQQVHANVFSTENSRISPPFPFLFSLFFPFGLLCSFQGSIWGILGRLIHRRETNYQIMKKFSEKLAGHLYRDSLPSHITRILQQTLKLSGIAFWEYDQDHGFILAEQAGNFTDPLPVLLTLPMDQSLLPEKPFRIKDQSGVYEFCAPLQNVENLQVGVCLVSPDTKSPLGFMSLGARDEEEFYGDLDLETLGIMAQQISLLLLVTNTMKERELVYQWAVEAEEHERRRIERELHDSISQYFHGQGKLLETINESIPEGRLKVLLERCVDETYKAAQELRVIINNLAYEQLQGNITQALVEYINHFKQRTKMNVYAQINLPVQTILPSEHRIALYRVIRQALDNIATHAYAKEVSVEVCQNEAQIDFSISDDGCGFTQERRADAVRQHHFGLWSMEGRIQDLKGKITIKSAVGEGTQIQGYIPI
jgi:signal transduction histidine kinase